MADVKTHSNCKTTRGVSVALSKPIEVGDLVRPRSGKWGLAIVVETGRTSLGRKDCLCFRLSFFNAADERANRLGVIEWCDDVLDRLS